MANSEEKTLTKLILSREAPLFYPDFPQNVFPVRAPCQLDHLHHHNDNGAPVLFIVALFQNCYLQLVKYKKKIPLNLTADLWSTPFSIWHNLLSVFHCVGICWHSCSDYELKVVEKGFVKQTRITNEFMSEAWHTRSWCGEVEKHEASKEIHGLHFSNWEAPFFLSKNI